MKDGKITPQERMTLTSAKKILEEYAKWQRKNPSRYNPTACYVAMDGARAIETFLDTQR